ncbi:MAG: hypothetical protein ACYS80_24445 [Planctomycetota bacterium]
MDNPLHVWVRPNLRLYYWLNRMADGRIHAAESVQVVRGSICSLQDGIQHANHHIDTQCHQGDKTQQ